MPAKTTTKTLRLGYLKTMGNTWADHAWAPRVAPATHWLTVVEGNTWLALQPLGAGEALQPAAALETGVGQRAPQGLVAQPRVSEAGVAQAVGLAQSCVPGVCSALVAHASCQVGVQGRQVVQPSRQATVWHVALHQQAATSHLG